MVARICKAVVNFQENKALILWDATPSMPSTLNKLFRHELFGSHRGEKQLFFIGLQNKNNVYFLLCCFN